MKYKLMPVSIHNCCVNIRGWFKDTDCLPAVAGRESELKPKVVCCKTKTKKLKSSVELRGAAVQ